MGLFNRGQAASALILDGKRAVRAYLGDQLVWDGTMDAFVPIPQILVSVVMADPVVSATVRTVAPLITASAQVYEPSVSGTATVRPETAILVAGVVYAPDVSAEALIEVPAISVSAIVLAPTVSEAFDATVEVPFIQVTAGMYSPKITADYAATVPIIAAFARVVGSVGDRNGNSCDQCSDDRGNWVSERAGSDRFKCSDSPSDCGFSDCVRARDSAGREGHRAVDHGHSNGLRTERSGDQLQPVWDDEER